jgi:hypothetical protein
MILTEKEASEIVRGKIAFKDDKRGYTFVGTYLESSKRDALIEIFKGDLIVRSFLFPAYKIWNIPAHADDIVDGLEKENDEGLYVAGSDGLGGNVYPRKPEAAD